MLVADLDRGRCRNGSEVACMVSAAASSSRRPSSLCVNERDAVQAAHWPVEGEQEVPACSPSAAGFSAPTPAQIEV